MQTNAFSHVTKNTLPEKCGGQSLMISIGDHLRKRIDKSYHRMLSLSGLKQKFQNKQNATKKINRNVNVIIPINQWRRLKCL
jgi:hypothetical protein